MCIYVNYIHIAPLRGKIIVASHLMFKMDMDDKKIQKKGAR